MVDLDPADFVVTLIDGRKSLIRRGAPQTSGVCVDFLSAALSYRAGSSLRQQAISRAVGIKLGRVPSVLDATAGFGKDAFLLASQGCEVTLLERDENVFELLSDGLERGLASADGAVLQALRRLRLQQRDFLTLTPAELTCEAVYLDPMFPDSKKSARVKKEMFALQEYLGAADDGEAMWEKACLLAQRRVVVKRSKSAPLISSVKPDLQLKGSSSRFDIYLTPK